MTTDRLRVIPKPSPRGLIPLLALVGMGTAPLVTWFLNSLLFSSLTPGIFSNPAIMIPFIILVAYTPLALAAALAGWRFQHAVRLAIGGAAYGVGLAAMLFFVSAVTSPDGGIEEADGWPNTLLAFAICGTIGAGVATVVIRMFRSTVFRTVHQTGQLCWACGYDLGGAAINTCPECATRRSDVQPARGKIGPALLVAMRWARPLLILTLVCTVGWGGWIIATRTIPSARFLSRFDAGNNASSGYIGAWKPPEDGKVYRMGNGRWIPLSPRTPGTVLVLIYDPSMPADQTTMELQVMPAPTPGIILTPGMPAAPIMAVCELTRQQAEWVINNGVPISIVEALADRVLAQPTPVPGTTNPVGQVSADAHFQGPGAK